MPWGAPSRLYVWLNAANGVSLAATSVDLRTLFLVPKRTCRIELVALHPALAGDADVEGLVGRTFADGSSWAAVNKLVLQTAKRVLRAEQNPAVFELGTLKITLRDVNAAATQAGSSSVPETKGAAHEQGCTRCKAGLKKPDSDNGSVNTMVGDLENDDEGGRDATSDERV